MSFNKKDFMKGINDLVEFLESNKEPSEEAVYGGTIMKPGCEKSLEMMFEPNEAISLESASESAFYVNLDINKLLRISYHKNNEVGEPVIVRFSLYPDSSKIMVRTGKSAQDGKIVYIYYAGGSKIAEEDEYINSMYRRKLPRIAYISSVIDPISIEQIRKCGRSTIIIEGDITNPRSSKKGYRVMAGFINDYLEGFKRRQIPSPCSLEEMMAVEESDVEEMMANGNKSTDEEQSGTGESGRVRVRARQGE